MAAKKALNIAVGARIKAARKSALLTQEQLAEIVGISAKNLSFIETGRFGVGLETLIRICKALHVSADALLFGQADDTAGTWARTLAALPPRQQKYIQRLLEVALGYFDSE